MKKSGSFKINYDSDTKHGIKSGENYYFNKDYESNYESPSFIDDISDEEIDSGYTEFIDNIINEIEISKDQEMNEKKREIIKKISKPLPEPLIDYNILEQNYLGLISDETIKNMLNECLDNIEKNEN